MPSVTHLLRPDVAALEPYTPIEPFEVLVERLGIPAEQIVKLDANENPYGPSPLALAALASYPHYAIYPDPNHMQLRQAISRYINQPPERIICGAGSDEIIDLLMRLFLKPSDAIIDCPPTFGMYAFDAGVQGADVINVPRDESFEINLGSIIEAVEQHQPKLLFLASPNNPTGNVTPRAVIERLLELPLLVVVDEAYAEFAGTSVVDLVESRPNLVVLRTFSKWAGLAGLRVGYAIVHEELIGHLWKIKQPYNVNAAAYAAALASLDDLELLKDSIARIIVERERLYDTLAAMPQLQVSPSRANFLLCRLHGRQLSNNGHGATNGANGRTAGERAAVALKEALMRRGILVRYYNKTRLRDYIRISIGTPAQNDTLLAALGELLADTVASEQQAMESVGGS
jgi:histidinol-phosphate aminotransferase